MENRWIILLILPLLIIFCNWWGDIEQANIKNIYKSDFYTPSIKICNLYGKRDSIDFPAGTLSVTYYRFESEKTIKIKDREKYKKVDSIAIMDFLRNRAFPGTINGEYLKSHEKDAICLYSEEKFPVYLSGSEQIIQYTSLKKWIVFWLKGDTYFVVHVQEDKSIHSQKITSKE